MIEPRPDEQALLDGCLHAPIGAAGVAQRGEAAHQHGVHGDRALGGEQGQRHIVQQPQVHLGQHDMDVAVDQPRHQRAVADRDARGGAGADRAVGDVLDEAVFDQHFDALGQLIAAGVEKASAGEEECGHGRLLNCVVDAMGQGFRESSSGQIAKHAA